MDINVPIYALATKKTHLIVMTSQEIVCVKKTGMELRVPLT